VFTSYSILTVPHCLERLFVQTVVRLTNAATRRINLFFLDYQGYCLLLPNDEKMKRLSNNFPPIHTVQVGL
jgi:hypothetical protein